MSLARSPEWEGESGSPANGHFTGVSVRKILRERVGLGDERALSVDCKSHVER